MKYKALITDLDGTLIPNRKDGIPSPNIITTIIQAQTKIHVGIATARSSHSLSSIFDVLHLSGPSIITGGAQIIDPQSKQVFSQKLLSISALYEVRSVAQKLDIGLTVADNEKEMELNNNYIPSEPLDVYTHPLPFEQAHNFIREISHISSIAVHIAPAWGTAGNVHVTISHPEATKLHGIIETAKILKIKTEEIIGIGEGYNDFPLLMACGLKIAMGDAVQEVKAIADYVAPSVEEDGVAYIIEKFIL